MSWTWPQIICAGLLILQVVVGVTLHGKPRDPYDGGTMVIGAAFTALLLGWGGFWN